MNVLPAQLPVSNPVTSLIQEPVANNKDTQPGESDAFQEPMAPDQNVSVASSNIIIGNGFAIANENYEIDDSVNYSASQSSSSDGVSTIAEPIISDKIVSVTDSNGIIENAFTVSSESFENSVNYSLNESVPTVDIVSASAQLADICKCGPNKCKPDGKCCADCPGMEGHYCHSEISEESSTVISSELKTYAINIPESVNSDLNDERSIWQEASVSVTDASCQTDEVQNSTNAVQCTCSCLITLNKDTLSLYKDFQHSNGCCCVHS